MATPKKVTMVPPIVAGAEHLGDGLTQGEEVCDDGSNNSDAWSFAGHCNATCSGQAGSCGDGVKQEEEICDDGSVLNSDDYAGSAQRCNLNCNGFAPSCGDGIVHQDDGEVCDDGNNWLKNAIMETRAVALVAQIAPLLPGFLIIAAMGTSMWCLS